MAAADTIPEVPLYSDTTQIVDLFNKLFGTNTSSSETTSPGNDAQKLIQDFLARTLPGIDSGQYSKESAIKDSQGLVDQIMSSFQERALPDIYQAQQNSGGYNSTTAQLLSNDAKTRAAAAGAAEQSKTITNYAQIQQQQKDSLLKLVLGMLTASKTTTKAQTNNASSPAAKGAAALSQALKNAMKPQQSPKPQQAPKGKPPETPRNESQDVEQDKQGSGDPTAIGGDSEEAATGAAMADLMNQAGLTGDESAGLNMDSPFLQDIDRQLANDLGGTPDTLGEDTSGGTDENFLPDQELPDFGDFFNEDPTTPDETDFGSNDFGDSGDFGLGGGEGGFPYDD